MTGRFQIMTGRFQTLVTVTVAIVMTNDVRLVRGALAATAFGWMALNILMLWRVIYLQLASRLCHLCHLCHRRMTHLTP